MAASSTPDISAMAGLQWPTGIDLQSPDSDVFKKATERWTIYAAPTFNSSLSPVTENQIVEIVGSWNTSSYDLTRYTSLGCQLIVVDVLNR